MKSISIKVAFCKSCKGYCSAIPVDKKDHNHPEIIDQFFYHGEPWFTFDQKTFDKKAQYEAIDVRILDLSVHRIKDNKYCHCSKTKKASQPTFVSANKKTDSVFFTSDYPEIEVYFQDLYHTYQNFHGLSYSGKHSAESLR